jgi:hypothetical protein
MGIALLYMLLYAFVDRNEVAGHRPGEGTGRIPAGLLE